MAKISDIIKIGFDYRASLEQFEKETNGVFDGITRKADKQRISIQLDAKNDKVIEKIKKLQKLKLDKFTFEFGESGLAEQLETFDQLEEKINEIINLSKGIIGKNSGNGIGNSIVDEKSLNDILDLFKKIESHLGEIKKVFSDVGDGKEFSPLLSTIDKINTSISELSASVKGIRLNMNIDVGSDSEAEAKVQSKISNALQAYERLFKHIKMSSAGGSIINQKFFEFDINQYDTMMGKLQAYKKFIGDMRKEAKAIYNGQDVLYQDTDKSYWGSASAAMGQVTHAFNEMDALPDTSSLESLFGKTDLSQVITQLELVVDKLNEISTTTSGFKDLFSNGLDVNHSVEEIEKLTNRVKELEDELEKIKISPTVDGNKSNISSGKPTTPIKKDDLDNIDDLLDDLLSEDGFIEELIGDLEEEAEATKKASQADEEYIETKKKLNSLLEGMGLNPELDDELSKENGLLKEQSQEVIEIENALNILTDRYVKLTNIIQSASNGWDGISDSIKQALIQLKLFDETGKFLGNFNEQGMVAQGAVMNGTHAIIARRSETYDRNDTSLYNYGTDDYLDLLIKKEQEAYDKGVSLARILSVVEGYDGIYEIQEQAKGNQVHDIARYSTLESYLEKCKIVTEATDEQLEKLLQDVITLNNLGFKLDFGVGNILYDKENGFSLIDLELREIDEKVPETQDLIRNLFKSLSGGELMEKYTNSGISNFISEDNLQRLNAMLSVAQRLQTVFDVSKVPYFDAIVNAQKEVSANLSKPTIKDVFQNDSNSSSDVIKEETSALIENANAVNQAVQAKQESIKADENAQNAADDTKPSLKDEAELMGQIATSASTAAQAKQDFVTANENVQDSVDGSKSPLQLEAELMQQIAKDARDAADAKKEFVEANKQVEQSANDSNGSVKKDKYKNRKKISEDEYTSRYSDFASIANKTLTDNGNAILGNSVSTELVNGLVKVSAKIKTVDGDWKTFSAKIDADGNMFEQRFNTITKGVNKLNSELENFEKDTVSTSDSEKAIFGFNENDLTSLQTKVNKLVDLPDGSHYFEYYDNQVAELSSKLNRLQEIVKIPIDTVTQDEIKEAEELKKNIDNLYSSLSNMKQSQRGWTDVSATSLAEKFNKALEDNPRLSKAARDEIKALYRELISGNPSRPLGEMKNRLNEIIQKEREAGRAGKNWLDIFKEKKIYGFLGQMASSIFSFYDLFNVIKQGIEVIKELDTAMVGVKKVSDETEASYAKFSKTIASTAKEIASTNTELLNSSSEYLRLGYNLDEAAKLAENTALFVNVGDGVDIEEATEDIITAMKAFNIEAEDSMKIVDSYNQIGNSYALSATDIGEAMKRSASALETANNSFEDSIGLITAMNEITQNAETTGTSLKVMSLRMRGAKADLESMGESTDDLAESTSKMREEVKALTGVDIMVDDNTFKSTAQQIKELGAVWDDLSDTSQAATLELIAGKSRANAEAALIQNYEKIDEVIADLEDSEGSALRENEAIVDSIEGRIKILSATAEEFWQSFKADDTIKTIISNVTVLLEIVTEIVDTAGILPTLLTASGGILGAKNLG